MKAADLGTEEWVDLRLSMNQSFVPKLKGVNTHDDRELGVHGLPPVRRRGGQAGQARRTWWTRDRSPWPLADATATATASPAPARPRRRPRPQDGHGRDAGAEARAPLGRAAPRRRGASGSPSRRLPLTSRSMWRREPLQLRLPPSRMITASRTISSGPAPSKARWTLHRPTRPSAGRPGTSMLALRLTSWLRARSSRTSMSWQPPLDGVAPRRTRAARRPWRGGGGRDRAQLLELGLDVDGVRGLDRPERLCSPVSSSANSTLGSAVAGGRRAEGSAASAGGRGRRRRRRRGRRGGRRVGHGRRAAGPTRPRWAPPPAWAATRPARPSCGPRRWPAARSPSASRRRRPRAARRPRSTGAPRGFSASFSVSTGRMLRMSRLLYWKTIGHLVEREPQLGQVHLQVAERLDVRVLRRRPGCRPRRRRRPRPSGPACGWRCRRPGRAPCRAGAGPSCPPITPDVEGQEVEEERAVGLGLEAHHLARASGRPSSGGCTGGWWSSRTGQDRSTRSWPSSASSCS